MISEMGEVKNMLSRKIVHKIDIRSMESVCHADKALNFGHLAMFICDAVLNICLYCTFYEDSSIHLTWSQTKSVE